MQPGREAAALLEAREGAPSRHERLLRAVLRRLTLAGQTQAQAVYSRRELQVQTLERGEVATRRGGNEFDRLSGGIHRSCSLQHF
jgi:hypothetical protein